MIEYLDSFFFGEVDHNVVKVDFESKGESDLLLPPVDLFSNWVSSESSNDSPELRFRRMCPELQIWRLSSKIFVHGGKYMIMTALRLETNGKSWQHFVPKLPWQFLN